MTTHDNGAYVQSGNESIVNPNAVYLLAATCPTGFHVGSVHAHIAGGTMTLDHPPVYLCGCTDPRCALGYEQGYEAP